MLKVDMGLSTKKIATYWSRPLQLSILSGVLVGTSYIPSLPWALLFCIVPLLCALRKTLSSQEAFKLAWVFQFVLTLIGFHWISYTATEFGNLPWYVGGLVLLLFCSLAHLYIPLAVVFWNIMRTHYWPESKNSWLSYWVLILLLNGFERIWPGMFPWNFGYPYLWSKLPIYQLADLVGFEGLSLVTLSTNLLIFGAWQSRKDEDQPFSRQIVSVVILFVLLNTLGFFHSKMWTRTNRVLKASVIQANIGNFQKVSAERNADVREAILQKYISLSQQEISSHPDTQIVIWPETAFPERLDTPFRQGFYQQQFIDFVRGTQKHFLTGAFSQDLASRTDYNGAFLIDPKGRTAGVYRKSILLAFGEYFPFSQYFPVLIKWFPEVATFGRGFGPHVVQFGAVKAGLQICYEGLFPDFSRSLSNQGAEVILNVTNDSWYGNYVEPYQHLYMTLARAIELRRPLVRTTNTGFSTAILADGTVLDRSSMDSEWTHTFEIPYMSDPPPTLFATLGDLWTPAIFVIALILMVLLSMKDGKFRLVGLATPSR